MDIASMAMSISAWKMQSFQMDLSVSMTKMAMDATKDSAAMLLSGIQSAPSSGMMDILV